MLQQLTVPVPSQSSAADGIGSGDGTVPLLTNRLRVILLLSALGSISNPAQERPSNSSPVHTLATPIPVNSLPETSFPRTVVVSAPRSRMPVPGGITAVISSRNDGNPPDVAYGIEGDRG